MGALTNLRSLELNDVSYSPASMASLTSLTSLQHACFDGCELPDSLERLTGLQVLQISDANSDDVALTDSLDSALRQLT